jgi:hypothetical protein
MNIFLMSSENPETLKKSLEAALNVELARVENEEYICYRFFDGEKRWFTIGTHDLDDDRAMPFSNYKYQIEIGVGGNENKDEILKQQREFAYNLFDNIRATNKYSLMLVEDVQRKLDEFVPDKK